MPKKNNAGNLKPNADRTPEQLRAMGAKGGVASGKARAKKRETRALARELLSLKPKAQKKTINALKKLGYDVETEGEPTVELLIQLQIANQAMTGDLASAKFLYDYAQIPDIHAAIERERIKAQSKSKVDLTVNGGENDALAEIRRRMEEARE